MNNPLDNGSPKGSSLGDLAPDKAALDEPTPDIPKDFGNGIDV